MSNDTICKATGIGNVKIWMFDSVARVLGTVRHIPNLRKNLISLGTVVLVGFMYIAHGGAMKMRKM